MKKQRIFVTVVWILTSVLQAAEKPRQVFPLRNIQISAFGYCVPHIKISEHVKHDYSDQVLFDADIDNNTEKIISVLLPVNEHAKRVSVYKKRESGWHYLGTAYISPEEMRYLVSIQHCLTREHNYLQLQFHGRPEINRCLEFLKK